MSHLDNATCLHWACDAGNLASVQWQVAHGADVSAVDRYARGGITLAAMHLSRDWDFKPCIEDTSLVIDWPTEANNNVAETQVDSESENREWEDEWRLRPWKGRNNPPNTANESVDFSYRAIIRFLLNSGSTELKAGNKRYLPVSVDSNTAFFEAFFNGAREVAELLLERGADINSTRNRSSALYQAVHNKDLESMEWLWQHGADINAHGLQGDPECLLLLVMKSDALPAIRWLIQKDADLSLINKTELNVSPVSRVESAETFKLLREAGVNFTSHKHVYRWFGTQMYRDWFFEVLDILQMDKPYTAEDLDDLLQMCLEFPMESEEIAHAETLLNRHRSWWKPHSRLIIQAVTHSAEEEFRENVRRADLRIAAVRLLLSHGCDIDYQNGHGESALHVICQGHVAKALPVLQASGADASRTDRLGATPLHYATENKDILKTLLDVYSDTLNLNAADRFGSTALHWTVLQDNLASIQLLLQAGADVTCRDDLGRAPFELPSVSSTAMRVLDWCKSPGKYLQTPVKGGSPPERITCSKDNNFFDQLKLGNRDGMEKETWQEWIEHLALKHLPHMKDLTSRVLNSTHMGLFCPGQGDQTLAACILEAFQEVAKSVAEKCPILETHVHLAGSNRDGTKVGKLDEVDLIFDLVHFRDQFKMEEIDNTSNGLVALQALTSGQQPEMDEFVDADGRLNLAKLSLTFNNYVLHEITEGVGLACDKKHVSIRVQKNVLNLLRAESISHCAFRWFSADDKNSVVDVDIVLRLNCLLPEDPEKQEFLSDPANKLLAPSLPALKCRHVVMKRNDMYNSWDHLGRLCVSDSEAAIFKKLPDQVRRGFMLLKAYRNSWFFPRDDYPKQGKHHFFSHAWNENSELDTYHLKQAFLHCVDQRLAKLQTDLDHCDSDRLTKAHAWDPNIPPALHWARYIVEYLKKAAQDKHLPCYLLEKRELFTDAHTPHVLEQWAQKLADIIKAIIDTYKNTAAGNWCKIFIRVPTKLCKWSKLASYRSWENDLSHYSPTWYGETVRMG